MFFFLTGLCADYTLLSVTELSIYTDRNQIGRVSDLPTFERKNVPPKCQKISFQSVSLSYLLFNKYIKLLFMRAMHFHKECHHFQSIQSLSIRLFEPITISSQIYLESFALDGIARSFRWLYQVHLVYVPKKSVREMTIDGAM